jgi:hypothetical protein
MKGCARTCALWLLGWAAASYAFYRYFVTLGDLREGLYWASGGAGLAVTLVCSYLFGIFGASRERSLLLESIHGGPLDDGKWVAVSGRIHSMHRLTAPLSGESVVAYKYSITRSEGSGKSRTTVTHFEGKALIPSSISTRTGSVKLLSVPTFDMDAADLDLTRAIANAQNYVAATQFDTRETPKEQRRDTVEKESTDDDGNFRSDRRSPNAFDIPLDSCSFSEHHIKQNEEICAFGLYSQQRSGLVPHPNWGKQTRIMRGSAETVAAQLRSRVIKYSFGVLFFGAVAYGVVKLCQYNAVPYQ